MMRHVAHQESITTTYIVRSSSKQCPSETKSSASTHSVHNISRSHHIQPQTTQSLKEVEPLLHPLCDRPFTLPSYKLHSVTSREYVRLTHTLVLQLAAVAAHAATNLLGHCHARVLRFWLPNYTYHLGSFRQIVPCRQVTISLLFTLLNYMTLRNTCKLMLHNVLTV